MHELSEEALLNFHQGSCRLPETGDRHPKRPHLTRDSFTLLAMGITGKKALSLKLAHIAAFNRLEAALHSPQPRHRVHRGGPGWRAVAARPEELSATT